jgi:hypothetical protein
VTAAAWYSTSVCDQRGSPRIDSGLVEIRVDRPVFVLDEDDQVDDADGALVDQSDQLVGHFADEVGCSGRKLDNHVVHGPRSSSDSSVMTAPFAW